jgi:hypothetical protein
LAIASPLRTGQSVNEQQKRTLKSFEVNWNEANDEDEES